MRSFNLLIAAFALLQVVRYARSALLFLVPSLRLRGDAGAEPGTPARLRVGTELRSLGFTPLGEVHASGPLGAGRREADAYASPAQGIYADVVQGRSADAPFVELFTPFGDGAAVLTSTARRRGSAGDRVQVGSMPDAPLAAVVAAHRKAVERFAVAHGAPDVASSLDARLGAGRRWLAGEGRRDLRATHLIGFVVSAIALALFVSSARLLLHAPGG